MDKEKIEKIVHQVLYNPQVSYPPISYSIVDHDGEEPYYSSQYMDKLDFERYLKRLEEQLIIRLTNQ